MYEFSRYFWFIAIGMPPITIYYVIKYWKMRKTPGYEWYELFYVMPLMYVTIMYSSISIVIKNEVGLLEAIFTWICSASLSITMIRIFVRKKKAGTYEPGKEKWFIPGIVFFSLLLIGVTAFVIAVALE